MPASFHNTQAQLCTECVRHKYELKVLSMLVEMRLLLRGCVCLEY
jgi:hypothetical protein